MGCGGSSAAKDVEGGGGGGEDGGMDEDAEYNPLTEEEVNARIVCSTKADLFPLGDSKFTLRYAYLSQRGYYP